MPDPRPVPGLSAFADGYAGFVIDQWGVLHDGQTPYPGALEALAELHRRDKRILLLSNSGRRADHNRRHLAELGFDLAMFDAVVTSGEAAWLHMRERSHPPFDGLKQRCLLLTRDGDQGVVQGLDIVVVERAEDADFLFMSGVDSPRLGIDDYRPILENAARLGLPAICSNPDHRAPASGQLVIAPGVLARIYEGLGGEVSYVGKPHRPIYETCLETLSGLKPEEIVGIGDSLEHDIKGATDAGFATAFVSGGLHAEELSAIPDEAALQEILRGLARRFDCRIDWVLPRLVW
jgi:HAD superfamily hydrolase (TIGR01459 family)